MKPLLSTLVALSLAVTATAIPARAGEPDPLPDEYTLREAWVGKLSFGPVDAVLQFRIVENEAGETAAFFDSISEGRTGLDAEWSIEGDALAFEVPRVGATFRGRLDAQRDSAQGRFAQGGREFPLTLERQATEYDPAHVWAKRPQRPQAPFPYSSEEVRFANERDGLTLAGTLTLPEGDGRHPAVVLISGSGQQDRDETLMEHKPFLVLADHLGRRGIAVLRYDDRGTAESTGDFALATTLDFAHDASAAVDYLQRHERIDPNLIGLVGHSEGGLVAPLVAAERDDVALIVLLAAPGVPGTTIAYSQTAAMIRVQGGDDGEVALMNLYLDALVAAVTDPEPEADVRSAIESAMADVTATLSEAELERIAEARQPFRAMLPTYASPWFRFFLQHDPAPTLRRVRCPVLALNGERDVQVLPELNLPAIEAALQAAGNPDFEVVELAGLNHLFQACETGSLREYVTIPETMNPAALEKIHGWIARRLLTDAK